MGSAKAGVGLARRSAEDEKMDKKAKINAKKAFFKGVFLYFLTLNFNTLIKMTPKGLFVLF